MKHSGAINLTQSLFLLQNTSNSCGVLIVFLGTNKVTVKKKLNDTEGRFIVLGVEITGENFVFVN